MRVITIPEPIKITVKKRLMGEAPLEKSEIVWFGLFLVYVCEGYEKFAKGSKMARQYAKVLDWIESMHEGQKTVNVEGDIYEILQGAMEFPQWPSPEVNRQYIPFYTAFENADTVKTPQDVKPTPEPAPVETEKKTP